jgi:hypothetical protein
LASNKRPVRPRLIVPLAALTLVAFAVAGLASLASAAATDATHPPARGCPSFGSQAAAQAFFLHYGGSPTRPVGRLDPDRDGVACEQLDGPYAGFARVGYNRSKDFFYGFAAMPRVGGPEEGNEYPCMLGNRHFSDGPRRVNVYRVESGPDKRIFPRNGVGAEPRTDTGHLVWKASRKVVLPGRYYVEFEERIRLHPSGENECPAFRSHVVALP